MLTVGLARVLAVLEWAAVDGEVWIDGSFVTEKVDPNDVDIILRLGAMAYDQGSAEMRSAVDFVESNLKSTHHCDSYVLYEWPEGHPAYWRGAYMHAYWMKQWGFDRQSTMKGIPVIRIGGGFHV